jgi:hypothetical protein
VYVQKRIRRGWGGRFLGFRANCEHVPTLPAGAVRWVWDDPRRIPYLLVWRDRRSGEVKDAVRVARSVPKTRLYEADSIEVQRSDGSIVPVYLAWRRQPKGGRSLLLRCWQCQRPSRALYGYKVGNDGRYIKAVLADWQCRVCAKLSYSSEGRALVCRASIVSRVFGRPVGPVCSPRPDSWLPYMFSSLDEAIPHLRRWEATYSRATRI